jgi:hypothetical protein
MNLRDVNWRFALYCGGLLGGAMWAVLASIVLDATNTVRARDFTVPSTVWVNLVATSLAILLAGTALIAFGRSITVRSAGVGLAICAVSGWVMIAWIAVQFVVWG